MEPVPDTPGVGSRRKHGAPKLPLSAFTTSPGSGVNSGQFPTPPSPSTIHPATVIDARVSVGSDAVGDLKAWKLDAGTVLGSKAAGVVLSVPATESSEAVLEQLKQAAADVPIVAVSLSFPLSEGAPSPPPAYLSSPPFPIALATPVTSTISPALIAGVKWALTSGHVVELDVETATGAGEAGWEYVEELVEKAQQVEEGSEAKSGKTPAIVINNILPPPARLDIPVVKLLTHPGYLAYQRHTASLSLLPNTYLKFIPPDWTAVNADSESQEEYTDSKRKEWKRRVKMYLGPAVEAFGDSRIIFGSSPTSYKPTSASRASDWYTLSRECVAELGVEQEGIDAIFSGNAKSIYGA